MQPLLDQSVQNELPLTFRTDRTAIDSGKMAQLIIVPQALTRLPDDRGWDFEGPLLADSDFVIRGQKAHPIQVKGYISSETGEGSFSIV